MKGLAIIWLWLLPFVSQGQWPLKDGKPTSKGIRQYVETMADSLIREYQQFIKDTIYNVWIYADPVFYGEQYDSMELGNYYPHEITITTAELFLAYELKDLTYEERFRLSESNRFVKSTIFHELTHEYINQITLEMTFMDRIRVNKAYQTYIWILHTEETFGSVFIEEGICEYITEKMREVIPPRRPHVPHSIPELTDPDNRYIMVYKYSAHYLRPFLDTVNFKAGVKVLLANPPPSYEELLEPDLFFNRLVIPAELAGKLKVTSRWPGEDPSQRTLRTNRVP